MIQVKVSGLPDLREALRSIPDKLRKRALRTALAAGGRVVRGAARQAAPIIPAAALPVRRGIRKPGTMRDAISVRTSKLSTRRGDVGVYVNVRPAKRGARGAKNPNDPYYWRWIEFGTKFAAPRPFLQEGAKKLGEALQVFIAKIGPQIAKLNKPKAPAP
jgi:HK97 gp10 family phage protein